MEKHLSAPEARELLKGPGLQIIDVRTLEEFEQGHIKGAKLADFRGSRFAAHFVRFDQAAPTLVYCKSGGRSTEALAVFKRHGFERLYHLDGGILAWQECGFPLQS